MLLLISSICLLYVACAILYQADDRRAAFPAVQVSRPLRYGLRGVSMGLWLLTLCMLAPLQGWERGVTLWFGLVSLVFVAGLFLAAQKPDWHAPAAFTLGGIGLLAGLGAIV